GPPTQPYHLYVRRSEPAIVFGSVEAGVDNPVGSDGLTFLDAVWNRAPFENHDQFVSAVDQLASEWEGSGAFSGGETAAIIEAARRAEADLRI
ncbi:MAG: hypothetical protein MUO50_07835, partial [Longimicrobiales bacterium]|nr:hypothetical protein [Longimicrobiales bacterium]